MASAITSSWSLIRYHRQRIVPVLINNLRCFSSTTVIRSKDDSEIPKNLMEEHITAHKQTTYGAVYDKKPFKVLLKPDKIYAWCTCGWSKNQPFCDSSHKNPYIKIILRPVRFKVAEEKEYYLCNCKQTTHRPFCDGTHKQQSVQEAQTIVKYP